MSTGSNRSIPWLDMQAFMHGSPSERIDTAMKFGACFRELGFVAITNIGIQKSTIDNAYLAAENYFKQPEAFKLQTRAPNGHAGYGTEHAKYTTVMDLKEFFQCRGINHPAHLWPEITNYKESMLALYAELETCMHNLLIATAIYLGYTNDQEQTYLSDMLGTHNGVMRVIHYPPMTSLSDTPADAVRSAAHEDLGIMTIIPRTTGPGLQVLNQQQEWIDVVVPDNAAIINSGDCLSIITNGIIPSTTHRVVNPPKTDNTARYSIPFFGNLIPSAPLAILDKCQQEPSKFPEFNTMTFNEFRERRYAEIGLSLMS